MQRFIIMSPGISILNSGSNSEESAEISTLAELEKKIGKFTSNDKCIMFLIDENDSKEAAYILKELIEKKFNISVEIEIVRNLSVRNISNTEFLNLINDFVSVVSRKILSIKGKEDSDVYVSLTSGYKIVSNVLSLIALLHNFKIIYFHKNSSDLLFFPQIDVEIGTNVWLKYWKIFFSLSIEDYTIGDFYKEFKIKEIPKAVKPFIYIKGNHIFLTSLGELLHKKAAQIYSDDKLNIKGVWKRKFIDDCFLYHMDKSGAVTFMILDIDNFKKINDSFGHESGDDILRQFVEIIMETLRTIFLKNKKYFLFPPQLIRWGGEEFVVIFQTENIEKEFIRDFAELIRKKVEDGKFKVKENSVEKLIPVTTSIGVAYDYPNNLNSSIDNVLFKRADEMVYKAKRNGRNRVEIWENID